MTAMQKRTLIWTAIAIAVALGLWIAFSPRPVAVDLATVQQGRMQVTLDEEAKTRVHDVFVLSAPVAGEMGRIEARVGDNLVANETVVASIVPGDSQFLDPRSETQARAAVRAAESAAVLARAEVDQAAAERKFAEVEYQRARKLITQGTITRHEYDNTERAFRSRSAALATAQAALQVKQFELQRAEAQLLSPSDVPTGSDGCDCVDVISPIDGQVLQVNNRSKRVVAAGEPLIEIGDPSDLEIVADYLSADAVKIKPGQKVMISNWGGAAPLSGSVRSVEPFGFTKVSALGIEEQRVNVIIDLTSPQEHWSSLGHGYQVETQTIIWEAAQVLTVPLTALFRVDRDWALFVADAGRAHLRIVRLGQRNGLTAEIVEGLEAAEVIVLHPSDRVQDGVRIRARA